MWKYVALKMLLSCMDSRGQCVARCLFPLSHSKVLTTEKSCRVAGLWQLWRNKHWIECVTRPRTKLKDKKTLCKNIKSGTKLAGEVLKYWLQIKHKKGIGEGHVTHKEERSFGNFFRLWKQIKLHLVKISSQLDRVLLCFCNLNVSRGQMKPYFCFLYKKTIFS